MSDRERVARSVWETLGSDYTFDEAVNGAEKASHAEGVDWVYSVADAAIAALRPEAQGVKVKPLEWAVETFDHRRMDGSGRGFFFEMFEARCPATGRLYEFLRMTACDGTHKTKLSNDTEVASIAAAKEHYKRLHEDRILSALDRPEAQDGVAEAAKVLLADLDALISGSEGVAGLHLNGDLAPWDELTESENLGSMETLRRALSQGGK